MKLLKKGGLEMVKKVLILLFVLKFCFIINLPNGLARELYVKEDFYTYKEEIVKYTTNLSYVITEEPIIGLDKVKIYENTRQKHISMEIGELLKDVIKEKVKMNIKSEEGEKEVIEKVGNKTGKKDINKLRVYFDFDSARLKECEKAKLKRWVENGSNLKVKVIGYADSLGKRDYNKKLAWKRAKNVANEIKKLGVEVVEIRGEGESEKECVYGLNRVVEVEIVE